MVDYNRNRLLNLGKEGCYTSRGFVTSTGQTSGVSIKSLSEIKNNEEKINSLSLGLARKASAIEKLSQNCKSSYQKYIDTTIPVCGKGVTGWLGKAAGTGSYEKCLAKVTKLRMPIEAGTGLFRKMNIKMSDLNADYSELLQYAPKKLDWQKLCESKLRLDGRHRELKKANMALIEKALKKLQDEQTRQEKADNEFNRFEKLLEMFLEALKALIAMVLAVFESFLRGLTKFSAFVADHPIVFWIGGGVVGLGVLAFIARPYISIGKAVLGINRR